MAFTALVLIKVCVIGTGQLQGEEETKNVI